MRASRSEPRLWDTDWLVLRPLARMLRQQAAEHVARGSVMVDFGCGGMPYAAAMRTLGFDYRGADISAGGDLQIDAGGRVPLPDTCAGAVLSIQVLEHVRDLSSYCAEIRRLLRDDGTLLLSTHGNWLYHPHPEDHRRWTRTGLALDLAAQGLIVEQCLAIVGPLATTTLIRMTGYAFMLRKLPLIGPPLAASLAVMMNARAWLEDFITPAQIRIDNASVYLVRARKAMP
jgi:SAM-dependent methyltransferase